MNECYYCLLYGKNFILWNHNVLVQNVNRQITYLNIFQWRSSTLRLLCSGKGISYLHPTVDRNEWGPKERMARVEKVIFHKH